MALTPSPPSPPPIKATLDWRKLIYGAGMGTYGLGAVISAIFYALGAAPFALPLALCLGVIILYAIDVRTGRYDPATPAQKLQRKVREVDEQIKLLQHKNNLSSRQFKADYLADISTQHKHLADLEARLMARMETPPDWETLVISAVDETLNLCLVRAHLLQGILDNPDERQVSAQLPPLKQQIASVKSSDPALAKDLGDQLQARQQLLEAIRATHAAWRRLDARIQAAIDKLTALAAQPEIDLGTGDMLRDLSNSQEDWAQTVRELNLASGQDSTLLRSTRRKMTN